MRVNQPNLFLLGAPKCGTTAIYTYLGTHPNVYFPDEKEPHFYAEDFPSHRICATRHEYERLYATVQPTHRVIGDASVLMLYSQTAIGRILADSPQARFVVAVRNPAELVISLHRQFVLSSREREFDFATAWQREVDSAPHLRSDPRDKDNQPTTTIPLLHYPRYGMLGTALSRLLAQVEMERVHILFLDDIQTRPRDAYFGLLEFLQLPDDGRRTFPRVNEGRRHRWPWLSRIVQSRPWMTKLFKRVGIASTLRALGTRPAQRTPLPIELKRELRDFFADEVRLLGELTGRDLSHWQTLEKSEASRLG